jgi:hypothetical protein
MKESFFIFSSLILFCCSNKTDTNKHNDVTNSLVNLFEEVTGVFSDEIEVVLIIPDIEACEFCKTRAMKFAEQHINDSRFRVILSGNSETSINYVILSHFNNSSADAVLIENRNRAFELGLVTIFPVLLKLSDSKVIEIYELNAGNIENILSELFNSPVK